MASYKVVIAEDEKLIRTGIAESIDWNALDAEVVGLAKNGTEAYSLIVKHDPDILLTDIQMTGGDGLELIRLVNGSHPDIKIIIISGYNNFSYAQRAIQLGVKEYILKPIDLDQLFGTLEKLVDAIKAKRLQKDEYERYSSFFEEYRKLLISDFFRDLAFGTLSQAEIDRAVIGYEYPHAQLPHIPVVLYAEVSTPNPSSSLYQAIENGLVPYLSRYGLCIESIFSIPSEIFYREITIVFSLTNTQPDTLSMITDIKSMMDTIAECTLLGVGCGEVTHTLFDLTFSYHNAKIYALYAMILGFNVRQKSSQEVPFHIPHSITETFKEIYDILSNTDQKPLNDYLGKLEIACKAEDVPPEQIQKGLLNILICVISSGDELGIPVRKFFPDLMTMYRFSNLKNSEELFRKISWACHLISSQNVTREDHLSVDLMKKAKNYILTSFDNPRISLETVAEYLGLTAGYFSRLYKKTYEMTYIEHVTQLRIEKAKTMLKEQKTIKISAIASSVGYNSPSYFNYIFKKVVGQTPKEYQNEHGL